MSSQQALSADQLYPGMLARVNNTLENVRDLEYYTNAYSSIVSADFDTLSSFETLPILRKSDFAELQKRSAPFGGLMAPDSRPEYLFVSPGPIHEPGFVTAEYWRIERVMQSARFTADDIVHNTFSYHLTPGAWIFDSGARTLGCSTIPAGNAAIELQLHAIKQYGASCYVGTPDFLKRLIEAYAEADMGSFPIKKALVSGGPFTPGLRVFFEQAGIRAIQCYATAELGSIAYDVEGYKGMQIDKDVYVEIVDPTTGLGMPYGAVGEVVVTTLRKDYPLIRFGTGDLSAFVTDDKPDAPPAIVGWLGRSDQAVKVRGMFVRPEQLELIRARIDGLNKVRLIIDRSNERDTAVLFCGFSAQELALAVDNKSAGIKEAVSSVCHLNIEISIVDDSTMSDDGKSIVDLR